MRWDKPLTLEQRNQALRRRAERHIAQWGFKTGMVTQVGPMGFHYRREPKEIIPRFVSWENAELGLRVTTLKVVPSKKPIRMASPTGPNPTGP